MVEALVKSKVAQTRTEAVIILESFSIRHEAKTAHHMFGNMNGLGRFLTPKAVYVDCLPAALNAEERKAMEVTVEHTKLAGRGLISKGTTVGGLFLPIVQKVLRIVTMTYQASDYISSADAVDMWSVKGNNFVGAGATERHWRDNEENDDEEWDPTHASDMSYYAERAHTDDRVLAAMKKLADTKKQAKKLVKDKVTGRALAEKKAEVAKATSALFAFEKIPHQNDVTAQLEGMSENDREKFEYRRKRLCDQLLDICDEELVYNNRVDEVAEDDEMESESGKDESDSDGDREWEMESASEDE